MIYSEQNIIAKLGKSEKTSENDVRIPLFAKLLRKTNLDEYPQFLNVLMGSMSTVGPRPHMLGEDLVLENNVDNYRVRRFVKPGITGLAAIKGFRGGTDDMSLMSERTKYDIWYLENWSIWLDIKIIIITIWQMITFRIPKAY
jgi:putative colanic acid biosynthesis UDP-glucose lipid carrier transferase